ncbi:hypothetical protein GCM10028801_04290 [Nocardioides maradonensis]
MTWTETHERTRILRHVAEVAATDMSGALPWREEWGQYFAGPTGLLHALRGRLEGMYDAQVDDHSPQDYEDTQHRIRESQAGVIAILRAGAHALRTIPAPVVPEPVVERVHFWQGRGGAALPTNVWR